MSSNPNPSSARPSPAAVVGVAAVFCVRVVRIDRRPVFRVRHRPDQPPSPESAVVVFRVRRRPARPSSSSASASSGSTTDIFRVSRRRLPARPPSLAASPSTPVVAFCVAQHGRRRLPRRPARPPSSSSTAAVSRVWRTAAAFVLLVSRVIRTPAVRSDRRRLSRLPHARMALSSCTVAGITHIRRTAAIHHPCKEETEDKDRQDRKQGRRIGGRKRKVGEDGGSH